MSRTIPSENTGRGIESFRAFPTYKGEAEVEERKKND